MSKSTLSIIAYALQSNLFLQHILLYHLENGQVRDAVSFATHYRNLVFFAHALEILLHTVVESDAAHAKEDGELPEDTKTVLPAVVEFLDHFDVCLDVIVSCARKIELSRWKHLFSIVGNPKGLFEVRCMMFTVGAIVLTLTAALPCSKSTENRWIIPPRATQSRATG